MATVKYGWYQLPCVNCQWGVNPFRNTYRITNLMNKDTADDCECESVHCSPIRCLVLTVVIKMLFVHLLLSQPLRLDATICYKWCRIIIWIFETTNNFRLKTSHFHAKTEVIMSESLYLHNGETEISSIVLDTAGTVIQICELWQSSVKIKTVTGFIRISFVDITCIRVI